MYPSTSLNYLNLFKQVSVCTSMHFSTTRSCFSQAHLPRHDTKFCAKKRRICVDPLEVIASSMVLIINVRALLQVIFFGLLVYCLAVSQRHSRSNSLSERNSYWLASYSPGQWETLLQVEKAPWWYVNLLEPYMVQLVRIDFGQSCCGRSSLFTFFSMFSVSFFKNRDKFIV